MHLLFGSPNNIINIIYERDIDFALIFFIIPIIPLNKFSYINFILLVVLKKIRIYIIFVKLFFGLLKKINMIFWVCYNLKFTIFIVIILIKIKISYIKPFIIFPR